MFYVKEKVNPFTWVSISLHNDNIFSKCPKCGCEIEVDLAKLFKNKDADLYSTNVYCKECSKLILENIGE